MHFLTDFADQAVVLPLATVVGLIFLAVGWFRAAIAWCIAICGTLATMLGLKLCMLACGWRWPVLEIHSPSGHAASAAVVYGGLLSLTMPRASLLLRVLLILAPTVLIAITRVYLQAHSVPEVISGGTVGLIGALALNWLAGERPQFMPKRKLRLLIGAAAVVIPSCAAWPAFAGRNEHSTHISNLLANVGLHTSCVTQAAPKWRGFPARFGQDVVSRRA